VIRIGDRVVVEGVTARVEERLEAVALGNAKVGSPLQVRLKIGGQVMRAILLAPGRARIISQAEPQARP
jgi:flagella basal body P-ring formation protein FlgA